MKRAEKKAKALARKAKAQQRVLDRGSVLLERALDAVQASERRNEFWRNLLVASAFARGLGSERPISEVVAEVHPELMRLQVSP